MGSKPPPRDGGIAADDLGLDNRCGLIETFRAAFGRP